MRPFFTYYGGKWSMARRYAPVRHELIIEPFAGSAGFSVRHEAPRAVLCDVNPQVAEVWRYLIATPADEIRALPLLLPGQDVADLPLCQEARWLIGWNLSKGAESPRRTLSAWGRVPKYASQFWGERVRERIASQVDLIRAGRLCMETSHSSICAKQLGSLIRRIPALPDDTTDSTGSTIRHLPSGARHSPVR